MAFKPKGKHAAKGSRPMDPSERERLEESVANLKSFVKLWLEFYLTFRRAFQGEPVTTEEEARFLGLKSQVARNHQYLYEELGDDYIGGVVITDLLRLIVNLEKVSKTLNENYYKVEKFWHEINLNLFDTITAIQFRLDQEEQQE